MFSMTAPGFGFSTLMCLFSTVNMIPRLIQTHRRAMLCLPERILGLEEHHAEILATEYEGLNDAGKQKFENFIVAEMLAAAAIGLKVELFMLPIVMNWRDKLNGALSCHSVSIIFDRRNQTVEWYDFVSVSDDFRTIESSPNPFLPQLKVLLPRALVKTYKLGSFENVTFTDQSIHFQQGDTCASFAFFIAWMRSYNSGGKMVQFIQYLNHDSRREDQAQLNILMTTISDAIFKLVKECLLKVPDYSGFRFRTDEDSNDEYNDAGAMEVDVGATEAEGPEIKDPGSERTDTDEDMESEPDIPFPNELDPSRLRDDDGNEDESAEQLAELFMTCAPEDNIFITLHAETYDFLRRYRKQFNFPIDLQRKLDPAFKYEFKEE